MKKLLFTFVALFAALSGGLAAAQDIVIGQSVPLSGADADIGRDMRDGAMAVFARANAANLLGRKIQLVTLDNANDRARAKQNTELLLGQHDAMVLFGYSSATVSLDALPMAAKNNLLFFAPFTGASEVRNLPNAFTVRASYQDETAKIIAAKRETGSTKAVVLHYDDEVGRSNYAMASAAYAEAGLPKPPGVAVKRGATLDAAAVDAILKDAPHYVLATTRYSVVGEYLKLANARGQVVPVAALSFVNPEELAELPDGLARGTVVAQVVPTPSASHQVSMPVVRECAEALQALNGAKLTYTSLESCIDAKVLLMAMKRAGPKITRESILQSMGTLGRIDLGGFTVNYTPSNHQGSNWVELTILSRGKRFVQ